MNTDYGKLNSKIKVFISSEMQTKESYIIRRSIVNLLELTGLFHCFAFEDLPSSHRNCQDYYLKYVEECDLFICIIGNQDVSLDAVIKEKKRAEELNKKSLYFFFIDGNTKEISEVERELTNNGRYKFIDNLKPCEVPEKVLLSSISCVIDVFQDKPVKNSLDNLRVNNQKIALNPKVTNINNEDNNINFIINNQYLKYKELNYYSKSITQDKKDKQNEFLNIFNYLIGEGDINNIDFDLIKNKLFKEENSYKDVLQLRFDGLKEFCFGNYENSIELLRRALKLCINNDYPEWLALNIAVDIHKLYYKIFNTNINSDGYDYVKKSKTPYYNPYLDKILSDFNSYLTVKSFDQNEYENKSISNNLDNLFNLIVNLFNRAIYIGSINYLFNISIFLSNLFYAIYKETTNHKILIELIRLSCFTKNTSLLKLIQNKYDLNSDLLNSTDVSEITASLANLNDIEKQTISKAILLSYFGMWFDDETFNNQTELLHNSIQNILDANKCYKADFDIIDVFYLTNAIRINQEFLLEFINKVMDNNILQLFKYCFNALSNINFSNMSKETNKSVKEIFLKFIKTKFAEDKYNGWQMALENFLNTNSINCLGEILETVKTNKNLDDSFVEIWQLNRNPLYRFNDLLTKLMEQNKLLEFKYCWCEKDYYTQMKELLKRDNLKLKKKHFIDLSKVIIDILVNPKQLVINKVNAFEILLLSRRFNEKEWINIVKDISKKRNEIYFVINDSSYCLISHLQIIISFIDIVIAKKCNSIILLEKLHQVSLLNKESHKLLLHIISSFLYAIKTDELSKDYTLTLISYLASNLNILDNEVKSFLTYSFCNLLKVNKEKNLIIVFLSYLFKHSNHISRILIIQEVKKITPIQNNKIVKEIYKMAKNDYHWLVREALKEIEYS